MEIKSTEYSYDKQNVKYTRHRQTDPFIFEYINKALGDAKTVLNVGAGSGSYEPVDRKVTAVEPSKLMREQRGADKVKAIEAFADDLPFDDDTFDASMAILTIHHWPDIKKGLLEMKRVTKNRVVVMTFDPDKVGEFWLAEYCPEMAEVDKARSPKIDFITETLGGFCTVNKVQVPYDCIDGFNEAFYGKPEGFLQESVRRSQSFWDFLPPETEQKAVEKLRSDLETGKCDKKYGHFRTQPKYEGAIRLIVAEK